MTIPQNLTDVFKTHSQEWRNNSSFRKMVINILVRCGTNLCQSIDSLCLAVARDLAAAILLLENYEGTGDIENVTYTLVVRAKVRDLFESGSCSVRDVLKFFRKRISCSCLKEMHLEARKTIPKLGMCYQCHTVKERSLLMVCSRCRIAQYCSRECQIADWSRHGGKECDYYVRHLEDSRDKEKSSINYIWQG